MGTGLRYPRPKTHPPSLQTLCFIRKDRDLLLLFRRFPPNAGYWNCPGGKVESWESPAEACIREVHEETGLRILNPHLRGLITLEVPQGSTHLFVFEATAFDGDLHESREGMLQWIPERYLNEEDEILPDIPVLFYELVHGREVLAARLSPPSLDSNRPRLIPIDPYTMISGMGHHGIPVNHGLDAGSRRRSSTAGD